MDKQRDEPEQGLANSSLNTSRVPPQPGVSRDPMPSNRPLAANDQQKGLEAMSKQNEAGSGSKHSQMPEQSHGGSNARGGSQKQGKEGNGAQKLQQKKK